MSPSSYQAQGALKPVENTIELRERPKTMLTPETKRTKRIGATSHSTVKYPTNIPIPSRRVIKALYDASLEEGQTNETEKPTTSSGAAHCNNQKYLNPAGLLSLEQILLPAVGMVEEKALKEAQSKVQRDAPEYKIVMENCRKLVRKSIRNAILEVKSSRHARMKNQEERRDQQVLERAQARDHRRRARIEERELLEKEEAQKKQIARAEKKRQLARESRRNQELWKEIVFLTSSVAQLEREERMWVQLEKDMMRSRNERQEEEQHKDDVELHSDEDSKSSQSPAVVVQAHKNPIQVITEEKVKDIVLASTRIQKGLGIVLELMDESEKVRKELYNKYKKEHVFKGYEAIDNPKGMIRFLSQSQDDYY